MKLRTDNYVGKSGKSNQLDKTIFTPIAGSHYNTIINVGKIAVPNEQIGKKCRILIEWL